MPQSLGVNDVMFNVKFVYDCGEDNITYDFAKQNWVFHHLDNEEKAYSEDYRILKPGAWFWIYTDGIDSIQTEIQDSAAKILKNYSSVKVGMILDLMGLSVGKDTIWGIACRQLIDIHLSMISKKDFKVMVFLTVYG